MKRKHLYLLLLGILLSSSMVLMVGYNDSEKVMINVFESSKTILGHRLSTRSNQRFALLTDSRVENLGGNNYQVVSYVDCQNNNQKDKRIQYTMTLHWNGHEYAMENLKTEGL
ncbi:hypothetical protein [Desulfosporosinus sp. SB140]|uniref:hypothetical protein n=1 Tax=Desulfosporosinus paludis TaxID=3115649 RepID=UPI00388E8E0F